MRKTHFSRNESGMSTGPALGMVAILGMVGTAVVLHGLSAMQFKAKTDSVARVEERHRAALTRLSSLVNTGALWFDSSTSNNVLRISAAPLVETETVYENQTFTAANAAKCGTEDVFGPVTDTSKCGASAQYVYEQNAAACGEQKYYALTFDNDVRSSCSMPMPSFEEYEEFLCQDGDGADRMCRNYLGWYPADDFNRCLEPSKSKIVANSCNVLKNNVPNTCNVKIGETPKTCTYTVPVAVTRPKPPTPPSEIKCVQESGAWRIPSGRNWCFLNHDRGSPTDGKVHALFVVCENLVNKVVANTSAPAGLSCAAGQTPVVVDVKFDGYKGKHGGTFVTLPLSASDDLETIYWGDAKATSFYGTEKPLTTASLMKLGSSKPNAKLDLAVSDADLCYFMRPKALNGTNDALVYDASGKANLTGLNLMPRTEGRSAGEYGGNVTIPALGGRGLGVYSVMPALREQALQSAYNNAYRGYTVTVASESRNRSVFMGVEPNQGSSGGPQFQYYLEDGISGGRFSHGARCQGNACSSTYDANKTARTINQTLDNWSGFPSKAHSPYSSACGNAAHLDADFCNRVDVPFSTVSSSFSKQCVKHSVTGFNDFIQWNDNGQPILKNGKFSLPGDKEHLGNNASRDVYTEVSCSPTWPNSVQWFVAKVENIEKLPNGSPLYEVYIQDLPALLALDMTKLSESGGLFERVPGSKILLDEAIKVQVDNKVNSVGEKKGFSWNSAALKPDLVISGDALRYGYDYYTVENLSTPFSLNNYSAKRCVYMGYKNIDNPKKCKVLMSAPEDNTVFTCRTADGCFAEDTLIRMADGTERKVTELRKGDLVWNPVTSAPGKVLRLTVGPEEKPMLRFVVNGKAVDVTTGHPFMTTSGWKKAQDLRLNDMVKSSFGSFAAVESIEALPVGAELPNVYNLAVDGPQDDDHFVMANGVVTGDLFVQERIGKK